MTLVGRSKLKHDIENLRNNYEITMDGDDVHVELKDSTRLVVSFYETCDYPKNSSGGSVMYTNGTRIQYPSIDFTDNTIQQIISNSVTNSDTNSVTNSDTNVIYNAASNSGEYVTSNFIDLIKSQLKDLKLPQKLVGVFERENTRTFIAYISIPLLELISVVHKFCFDIIDANFITIIIEYNKQNGTIEKIKIVSSKSDTLIPSECWRACYPGNSLLSSIREELNSKEFAKSEPLEIYLKRVECNNLHSIYQNVTQYFKNPSKWCSACADPHPLDLKCILPYPCKKPLCIHQSIHVNKKVSVGKQIKQHSFISDFLITTTYLAAKEGQLVPFPECGYHVDGKLRLVENCDQVINLLDSVPPMIDLVNLKETEIEGILNDIDPLLLHLIQWIFTSNPNFMYYLSDNKIPAISDTHHQIQLGN